MTQSITGKDWQKFLEQEKKIHRIPSLAILNLSGKTIRELPEKIAGQYQAMTNSFAPEYILKTLAIRLNPQQLYPWAKSLFIAAIPFDLLPEPKNFIPKTAEPLFVGKIAGYAARQDYHIFAQGLFKKFSEDLTSFICQFHPDPLAFKSELCVDTKPVAERSLAVAANLGIIGRNFSLLTHDSGTSCFIAELFTDIEAPDIKDSPQKISCGSCSSCISSCSTGALASPACFGYNLCRSCLTMEKRGILSSSERKLINGWIFGCDDCSSCCPASKLPHLFPADIKWLLTTPPGQIKERISGTPLEYAGVTLLRRNALVVLGNRNNESALALIKKFTAETGSNLLKTTAEDIVRENNKN